MALSEHLLQGSTSRGKRSCYGEILVLLAVVTGCITVLVMSGSGQTLVAKGSAIEATAFVDGRDLLVSELGMKKSQRDAFLSRSSVLARINSPGFWKALRGLRIARGMSSRQIFTLVTNGVAAKLESADFMSAFNTLFDRFTSKQIVTLMSDSVAAGLEHPRFMTAFNALSDRFASQQVITLMSDSVAAGLEHPRFMMAFNAVIGRLVDPTSLHDDLQRLVRLVHVRLSGHAPAGRCRRQAPGSTLHDGLQRVA